MNTGKVWLVGAGPGDVGLFTLKGKDVLQNSDVVVYDSLVGQGVLSLIPHGVRTINVGKRASNHLVPQAEINKILLNEALAGNRVVRLKGGDPFLFGRGAEELELLKKHHIPFEIVCGVTSAIAVPAYLGIPVTHRDMTSSLHIITGHTQKGEGSNIDFSALVKLNGTLVFLMGIGAMNHICTSLISAGMAKDMPAAVLEKGTTAHQRRVVSTLENLCEDSEKAKVQTPAIIVVGKVCTLGEDFHWAEDRALGGVKIVVTRPQSRASVMTDKLNALGAEVVELPAIKTTAIEPNNKLRAVLKTVAQYDVIAFTSPVGVAVFFEQMKKYAMDIRELIGIRFAAIGTATKKAIEEKGMFVHIMPETYSAEFLADAIAQNIKVGQKVLIPRAEAGSEALTDGLKEEGISFLDVPIYRTNWEETHVIDWEEQAGLADYIAFTSASTVVGFVKNMGNLDGKHLRAVCIGEQTAKEARQLGMEVFVAKQATMDSMIDLILALEQEKRGKEKFFL